MIKLREKKYEVSVVVLTYHPDWNSLQLTLASILAQKEIHLQIVVADDGSINNCFAQIKGYFAEKHFTDYELVTAEHNRGTVENLKAGLEVCEGDYVKAISPGDLLYGLDVLHAWYALCKKNAWIYSFCNCVYYNRPWKEEPAKIQLQEVYSFPQQKYMEDKTDTKQFRYRYLILKDICLGAAQFCERDTFYRYVMRIAGHVRFAEDNTWRLMAYDEVPFGFYNCNAVLYEYGNGISTAKNTAWQKKLDDDWKAADALLLESMAQTDHHQDPYQQHFDKVLKMRIASDASGGIHKMDLFLHAPGMLKQKMAKVFHTYRRTEKEVKMDFLDSVGLKNS